MSKAPTILALYELRISVEEDGILIQRFKTPVTFTGKNYVPQRLDDRMEKEGYNYFGIGSRVKADALMKPMRDAMWDKADHVGRSIYYLEGQEDEAKKLLKADLEKTIDSMKQQMDAVHLAWHNKILRPRRK